MKEAKAVPARWLKVASLSGLAPGGAKEIKVVGRSIAVFNTGRGLYAVEGVCRHMNARLVNGILCGTKVRCRWHGWEYDLTEGKCVTKERRPLATYRVKVERGIVFVDAGPLLVEHELEPFGES